MEAEEIGVVLARASELHAKINDAIERAMKSAFLHSTSGKSLDSEYPSSSYAAAATGQEEKEYDNFELYDEREVVGAASVTGVGNAEARSLSSIRDALAVLEEQLEALQVGIFSPLTCPTLASDHSFLFVSKQAGRFCLLSFFTSLFPYVEVIRLRNYCITLLSFHIPLSHELSIYS